MDGQDRGKERPKILLLLLLPLRLPNNYLIHLSWVCASPQPRKYISRNVIPKRERKGNFFFLTVRRCSTRRRVDRLWDVSRRPSSTCPRWRDSSTESCPASQDGWSRSARQRGVMISPPLGSPSCDRGTSEGNIMKMINWGVYISGDYMVVRIVEIVKINVMKDKGGKKNGKIVWMMV